MREKQENWNKGEETMKKIAVVFPGVGYHADKPLLYYSRKIVGRYGYEIVCADYGQLPLYPTL